jgi:hypothetical protein
MKAVNIIWDVDEKEELDFLPKEIEIPSEIENNIEAISDYLSDVTGFCHKGFNIDTNRWTLTDDDSQQYVRPTDNEDEFDLIQMSLINPETEEFIVYFSNIDVMSILEQERPAICEILQSYGYGENDDSEDAPINAVIGIYNDNASQIIAECYFEYYNTFEADEILFKGSEQECIDFIQNWIKTH